MEFSKIEQCLRNLAATDEDYSKLLDETAKLSQIRTGKWINFWSIFTIVSMTLSILGSIIVLGLSM